MPNNRQLLAAGLSAARQLRAKGMEVVVLEGHSRPGGRVYSKKLQVRPAALLRVELGTQGADVT